ncbi:MAG TPA: hypothetical protein VIY28_04760 [Pseudonocardiaceae bacterium]
MGLDTATGAGREEWLDQVYSDISLCYTGFKDGQPTATSIRTGDVSWEEVTLADEDGTHHVSEGGPRRVWRIIEDTHALWNNLGQPGWDRFGLTVTEDHQRVWLDTPTNIRTWSLPSRAGRDE